MGSSAISAGLDDLDALGYDCRLGNVGLGGCRGDRGGRLARPLREIMRRGLVACRVAEAVKKDDVDRSRW